MAPHPNLTKRSSRGTRPGRQGASGVLPCGGQCRPLLCRINCQVAARCNHDCHLRSGLGGCRWAGGQLHGSLPGPARERVEGVVPAQRAGSVHTGARR